MNLLGRFQTLLIVSFLAMFAGLISFWMLVETTGTHELAGFMCAAISMSGYLGARRLIFCCYLGGNSKEQCRG